MTPLKAPRGGLFSHDAPNEGIRLFDDQDEEMESPPGMSHKNRGLPTTQLVGDNNSRRSKPTSSDESTASDTDDSVLRNMDMNTPTYKRKKRPSDQHPAGREDRMLDSDDDSAMFLSPRISPSYRTLDGRTVTSKNPFSPYTPTPATDGALDMNTDMQTAPSFPVTLNSSHYSFDSSETKATDNSSVSSLTGPAIRPKLNLQRRNASHVDEPVPARAGYPDPHGRYSFTGSPIEEIDIMEHNDSMGSKIRRLHMSDNASSAHSLFVDTTEAQKTIAKDEISPNDVMQFPPSAPRKPSRYTPLRAAVPHTPIPPRRTVARRPYRYSTHEEDDAMDTESVKSRFYQDFDIIDELGTGSFGTVYKCLSRLDGCMYAVKAAKRKATGNADRDRMLKEVYALAALSDQADTAAFHCVRYHQAWMEENRLYIQTELCTSTLQTEMTRNFHIAKKWRLMREMLLALKFIHRNGMVHLDIKPENIFTKNDQFKLGDFGLVSKITNHNDVEEGDSRYMSKELLSGDHEDLTKSDIFSLGATMYEICLGRPLPSDGPEWQAIRAGHLLPLQATPFEMELIIKEMMHPDPNKRPSASQLLTRKQLLSDEQKQLMAEKSKVLEANLALALQTKKMKTLSPPPPKTLMRANTWNGSSLY